MTTPMRPNSSYAEVARQLDAIADRNQPARTLDLLVRMLKLNDRKMEDRSGISRQTLNGKRSGASPIRARDLWPLADALEVEVDVLLMPPSQAAAWLVQHRSDELDGLASLGNGDRQHNGDPGTTSHIASKGSRHRIVARQRRACRNMLAGSATAA